MMLAPGDSCSEAAEQSHQKPSRHGATTTQQLTYHMDWSGAVGIWQRWRHPWRPRTEDRTAAPRPSYLGRTTGKPGRGAHLPVKLSLM